MEKTKRLNNPYDPNYVSKRDNISLEEAIEKVNILKKKKATSLEGFILRHGEEIGKQMFEKFQNTSKHTKDKFIQKYGYENGIEKWNEYLKSKDSSSYEWALKKANGDEEKAKKIFNDRIEQLSIKFDDDYFKSKYGEKWKEEKEKFSINKDTSSINWALKRTNGNILAASELYALRSKDKDSSSYEWALKKANGDKNEAQKILNDRITNIKFDDDYFKSKYKDDWQEQRKIFKECRDSSSYEWALKKSNGDANEATELYYLRNKKKVVGLGRASKESLSVFLPLYEMLIEMGFDDKDIFFGHGDKTEYFIYDRELKKIFTYDFYVRSLNLIIEYHGEAFHPNYFDYDVEYLKENFKHPFGRDVEESIEVDKRKVDLANKNGKNIYIIWSNRKDKLEYAKSIIKTNIKRYEN